MALRSQKKPQQRRMVLVIVHDWWVTSSAALWTLPKTNCSITKLMANCSKLTARGTQNFAVELM